MLERDIMLFKWRPARLAQRESATYACPLAKQRELEASRAYRKIVREEPIMNGMFMADIIRGGMKNEDFL